MNLSEFKAWFEGFTENLDGAPNAKAWKRICDKVKAITPDPTPLPVFVERYRPYYPNWKYWTYLGGGCGVGSALQGSWHGQAMQTGAVSSNAAAGAVAPMPAGNSYTVQLSAADAFRELGRMDAQTIT